MSKQNESVSASKGSSGDIEIANAKAGTVMKDDVEEGQHVDSFRERSGYFLVEWFLYGLFTIIVTLSILVICHGIVQDWCVLKFNPAALFIILILALTLLAYVEALHYSNVSVERWDMSVYQEKFPRACKVQLLVNSNVKVQRFLVGRQFFVIFVVFIIAQCTTLPSTPVDYLGMPTGLVLGLVRSGLPGIMLTLTIGQLVPQLFVEEFTLPFMNLYGCWFVTQLAFFAEFIGVCNFSWLLFYIVDHVFYGEQQQAPVVTLNQPGAQNNASVPSAEAALAEPAAGFMSNEESAMAEEHKIRLGWFDICKYIWSTAFTGFAFVVVGFGISKHYSVLPVPVPALYIIFILALTLLFYLEGLMICIVATQYWNPEDFKESHPRAYTLHKIVNRPDVVKRFIVGRQFFTLLTNFLLAQISVFPAFPNSGYNAIAFFIFIKSGLVGVMITLAVAQLLPELLAAKHPLSFMNFYGSTAIVNVSLLIESFGVGHCAWFIFHATKGLCCARHVEDQDHKPSLGQKAVDHSAHHSVPPNEPQEVHEVQVIVAPTEDGENERV